MPYPMFPVPSGKTWPTLSLSKNSETVEIPFCYSTFEVWPELAALLEQRRAIVEGKCRDKQNR